VTRGIALGLALTLACGPALRPSGPATEAGAPGLEAGQSAAALLQEARASFARRPALDQVRRAESLFAAAARADPQDVEGLSGAIQAKIWLTYHDRRADADALAAGAVEAGQSCLRRAPASALCHYGMALALGVQARARRTTALEGLKRMVAHLERAADEDPTVDHAGPRRVLALVLVRAPGWPIGPGDPEAALGAARDAVRLSPEYPPNQLALAEALLATGATEEGRAAARRGAALARGRAGDPDAEEWIRDGEALLSRSTRGAGTPGS
jgi:tetratricopeptide (TPR) repeat protein